MRHSLPENSLCSLGPSRLPFNKATIQFHHIIITHHRPEPPRVTSCQRNERDTPATSPDDL
jgi:hypothetical protein